MSQSCITNFFTKKRDLESHSEDEPAGTSSGDIGSQSASQSQDVGSVKKPSHSAKKTSKQQKLKKQKVAQDFNPDWQEGRPWLVYKPTEGMYCRLCTKYNKKPFGRAAWNTEPSVRIRKITVREHEKSCEHKDSVKLDITVRQSKNVGLALTTPDQVSKDGMVQAFQCLYFLCKNTIAHTTNFPKLLELEKLLGLDIMAKIKKGNNAKYTSEQAIKEMLLCLSELIEKRILTEIKESDSYSLMFDETTDISTIEQMVIHCRFIDGNGEVCIKYLKILDVLEFTKK